MLLAFFAHAGEKKMPPLYRTLSPKVIPQMPPKLYPLNPGQLLDEIFQVPYDNTVGTNVINNAITLLHLEPERDQYQGKVKYEEVARDFLQDVSGGGLSYLPLFSEQFIGYSQTRRFVMFDLKKKQHTRFAVCTGFEDSIEKLAVSDAAKHIFITEISHLPGNNRERRELWLADLSGDKETEFNQHPERILKRLVIEPEKQDGIKKTHWFVSGKTLFTHTGRSLNAYDLQLNPIHHPFVTAFNAYWNRFDYVEKFVVHPTLPFAIVYSYPDTWVFRWNEKKEEQFVKIIEKYYLGKFEFSPDGNWLVALDSTASSIESSRYVLFPIDKKLPHFVAPPINMMGDIKGDFGSATWTRNPVSFVTTDTEILRQWFMPKLPLKIEGGIVKP